MSMEEENLEGTNLDDDDEVQGGGLPSFSGGGALPSFSGAPHTDGASPSLTAKTGGGKKPGADKLAGGGAAGGGGGGGGGKKRKLIMEDDTTDAASPAATESVGVTPVKKKAKKKKTGEDKAKDGALPAKGKSPSKSKEKGKDADGDKDGDDKKDGEAGDRKEGGGEDDDDDDALEQELDVDEDLKYADEYKQRESELLQSCSEEEFRRYETMRVSKFDHQGLKNLIAHAADVGAASLLKPFLHAVSGVSKIFVGEIVDTARLVRREYGDDETEPLQPRHIREAHRRLTMVGNIPESRKPKLFRR